MYQGVGLVCQGVAVRKNREPKNRKAPRPFQGEAQGRSLAG